MTEYSLPALAARAGMSPRQKAAFLARYRDGLTDRAAAAALGVSVACYRVHVSQANKRWRAWVVKQATDRLIHEIVVARREAM